MSFTSLNKSMAPFPFESLFTNVENIPYNVIESETSFLIPHDKKMDVYVMQPDFKTRNGIIIFYSGWCRECEQISKTWTQVSRATGKMFPVVTFNCFDKADAIMRIDRMLKLYKKPLIQIMNKDGSLRVYIGPATGRAIIDFLCCY
jgi:hypothetical protein